MSKLSEELAFEDGMFDTDIDDEDYGFVFSADGELKSVFLPENLPFKTPENIQKILAMFGITDPEQIAGDNNSTLGMAEVIIAKHRNGSLDTAKLKFIGKYTKFADYDGDEPQENNPFSGMITRESRINRLPETQQDSGDEPLPF